MKKFLLGAASLMLLLGASSCSQEEILPVGEGNGDGTVLFNLGVPSSEFGDVTRAEGYLFGDGTTAVHLIYAAYEHKSDGSLVLADYSVRDTKNDFVNLKTSVTLKLVNGKTYDIVFWADACDPTDPTPIYTFDKENHKINIDYEGAAQNDETRDAFFNVVSDLKVDGNTSNQTVVLHRPFAQLNIGSRDLNEPAVATAFPDGIQVALKAKSATQLDLVDGSVNDMEDVNFVVTPRPLGQTFPHQDPNVDKTGYVYEYLAMDYLLVGPIELNDKGYEKENLVDVTYSFYNGTSEFVHERTVAAVPLKRNYQTNIFGPLLTSSTQFNVEINPIFEVPHMDVTWLDFRDFMREATAGGTIVLDRDIYFGNWSSWAENGSTVCRDERDEKVQIDYGVTTTVDLNGHTLYNASFEVFGTLNIIDTSGSNTGSMYANVHQQPWDLGYNPLFTVRKASNANRGGEINIYAGNYYPGRISNNLANAVVYDGPEQQGTVNVFGGTFEGELNSNGQYNQFCVYDDYSDRHTAVNIHAGTFIQIGAKETHDTNGGSAEWARATINGKSAWICKPDEATKLITGGDVTVNEGSALIDTYGTLDLTVGNMFRSKPLNVTLNASVNRVYIGNFSQPVTLTVTDNGKIGYQQLLVIGDVVRNFTLKGADGADRPNLMGSCGGQLDWTNKTVENVRFENVSGLTSIDYSGGSVSNVSYVNVSLFGYECPVVKMTNMKRAENIVIDGNGTWNYLGHVGSPSASEKVLQLEGLTGDVRINSCYFYNYSGTAISVQTKGNVTIENVYTTCGGDNNLDAIVVDGSRGMKSCTIRNNNITTGTAGNRLYLKELTDGCALAIYENMIDMSNPGMATQTDRPQNYGINISRADGSKVNCSSWSIHDNHWNAFVGFEHRSNIYIVDFPDPSEGEEALSYAYRSEEYQIEKFGFSGKNAKRRK